jgi:hypothetical protein
MRRNSPWVGVVGICLILVMGVAACGDSSDGPNCTAAGAGCALDADCCTGHCDTDTAVCTRLPGECRAAGDDCASGPDCCSFACVDFQCSASQCTSDGAECSSNDQCCSGSCNGGTCTPLNTTCKTSGNACTDSSECCSHYCLNGVCDPDPSFCRQSGDTCTSDLECCGGSCAIASGATLGLCQLVPASGAGSCTTAGEACTPERDASGNYQCGSSCCSRACYPFGSSGITVCQPPSGCAPTGEICREDHDCCGSANQPDGGTSMITCSKLPGQTVGRCDNGNSCTPAGGICRLQSNECSQNANCCAGNVLQFNTCAEDNLGIPRCLTAEIDCTDPSQYEGETCATSADCCGLPCTPMGSGEFPPLVCGGMSCVPSGGVCTTTADCCSTLPCENGVCGEPGVCAEFGQQCTTSADCCSGLPCEGGFCGIVG